MLNEQDLFKIKGIFIKPKLLVVIIFAVIVIYAATVLGLVFGLPPILRNYVNSSNYNQEEITLPTTTTTTTTTTTKYFSTTSLTKKFETDTKVVQYTTKRIGYKIPKDLLPFYYKLTIETNFYGDIVPETYNGSVKIYFECSKVTNKLILNAKSLKILESSIFIKNLLMDKIEHKILNVTFNEEKEILMIETDKKFLIGGNYSVFIQFRGFFSDDMTGFYRSSYKNEFGTKRWLVASHMRQNDARKHFPCFDNSDMKARYKVIIKHHKNYTAISNMPIVAKKNLGSETEFIETEFDETVPISTNLIGLFITDFKCKNATKNSGTLDIRVCAKSNVFDKLDYSLKIAVLSVEFLQNYFGLSFPLPKIDHIAFEELNPDSADTFGLATYRELYFLIDEKVATFIQKKRAFRKITYETSRMLFKDLISIKWWDDLLLIDGFADFVENLNKDNKNNASKIVD